MSLKLPEPGGQLRPRVPSGPGEGQESRSPGFSPAPQGPPPRSLRQAHPPPSHSPWNVGEPAPSPGLPTGSRGAQLAKAGGRGHRGRKGASPLAFKGLHGARGSSGWRLTHPQGVTSPAAGAVGGAGKASAFSSVPWRAGGSGGLGSALPTRLAPQGTAPSRGPALGAPRPSPKKGQARPAGQPGGPRGEGQGTQLGEDSESSWGHRGCHRKSPHSSYYYRLPDAGGSRTNKERPLVSECRAGPQVGEQGGVCTAQKPSLPGTYC